MRIAFVGGGTAGHFYPLIAIAEQLADHPKRPQLYYFGPEPYDQSLLTQYNIRFVSIPAGKTRRYFSIQNILDIFRSLFGVFVAIGKLYSIYPDVVMSKGGYTSVPVLIAARLLRVPVVIHESDAAPGRANRLARSFARYIGIAHPEVAAHFPAEKTALIGIPIRQALRSAHPDPFTYLGIPNDRPLIYVTGGSLGAERINNLMLRMVKELLPRYTIFHQTGAANQDELTLTAKALIDDPELQQHYYIQGTVDPVTVNALMSAATLIITRAGSTTLFEIALHGTPSIIIPIPESISHDQVKNAYSYARAGAAIVMEEENFTPSLLIAEIDSIIGNPERRETMSAAARELATPDAAEKLASVLVAIGTEHGS